MFPCSLDEPEKINDISVWNSDRVTQIRRVIERITNRLFQFSLFGVVVAGLGCAFMQVATRGMPTNQTVRVVCLDCDSTMTIRSDQKYHCIQCEAGGHPKKDGVARSKSRFALRQFRHAAAR